MRAFLVMRVKSDVSASVDTDHGSIG
jgi:hypothetical protein